MRHVHSDRLERWLGADEAARISAQMRDWYGPPISVLGVPGRVCAVRGGDFVGRIHGGGFMSLAEQQYDRMGSFLRRMSRPRHGELHAGFSSLSALIAAATAGGQRYDYYFQKAGTTAVVGGAMSLWRVGNQPAAGAAASTAPGGDVPTSATTGAIAFANPTGGKQQFLTTGYVQSSQSGMPLLLYDRLFEVNKTMSSTATEAVTGSLTRYTNTVAGSVDSAEGNFLFIEIGGVLGATAHNWTVCQYTNQAGTTGKTLPSVTGISAGTVNSLDHPNNRWFCPLASGDTGISALTQMQCSASVTGTISFVIGHPLAWVPVALGSFLSVYDGINSIFNMPRIFDSAALALLLPFPAVTTAANINAHFSSYSV